MRTRGLELATSAVPWARPQSRQLLVHRPEVERVRIEAPADPLQHGRVLLVLGIADRLQKLLIAPDPTDILRRTGPSAGQASRVQHTRLRREHLLHEDVVLPVVAEVVQVAEAGARVGSNATELRRLGASNGNVA